MTRNRILIYGGLLILFSILWLFSDLANKEKEVSELAKIALRNVGHQLLLTNQDSTSLVLPVLKLEEFKYSVSFQNRLSIEPDSLVSIVKQSFQKAGLSEYYIVKVIQCLDNEVAFSYKMRNEKDKSIIPCGGRSLPNSCYTLETQFLEKPTLFFSKRNFLSFLGLLGFIIILDFLVNRNKKQRTTSNTTPQNGTSIGSYTFYQEQNKLVKDALEISLSQKECELLAIFISKPNHVIRRNELTKKVWEDKGVIVGRSLDTYISKLRKIFKADNSISFTNVHGVGYKLEINN